MNRLFKFYTLLLLLLPGGLSLLQAQEWTKVHPEEFAFFEANKIHRIDIEFAQPDYISQLTTFKTIREKEEKTNYLVADVRVDGELLKKCGVRYKGHSSYKFHPGNKKAFKIDFGEFVDKQKYQGHKKFNLQNAFRDPTFLRDKLYLDLCNEAGVLAPMATYTELFINGASMGLYIVVEQVDDEFLERRFGTDEGELFKGEPQAYFKYLGNDLETYMYKYAPKENVDEAAYSRLVYFTEMLSNFQLDKASYQKFAEQFYLPGLLKAFAINNLTLNSDASNMFFRHNFYFWRHPSSGKYHWIAYDGNYSFGGWNNQFAEKDYLNLRYDYVHESADFFPLSSYVMKHPSTRLLYARYYLEILRNHFSVPKMNAKIDQIANMIRPCVANDDQKMYSTAEFDQNISETIGDPLDPGAYLIGIKKLIAARNDAIRAQLNADL